MFHCYANGWPAPSFAWLKEGKKIKSGDAMNSLVLTTRLGGLDLEIFYIRQKEHAGRYTCVAYNKFGKKRHNILLSVLGTFTFFFQRVDLVWFQNISITGTEEH